MRLLSLADILAALRHPCGQAKTLRDRPARLPKVLRGTAKVLRFSEHLAEEDGNTIIIQKAFSSRDNAEAQPETACITAGFLGKTSPLSRLGSSSSWPFTLGPNTHSGCR